MNGYQIEIWDERWPTEGTANKPSRMVAVSFDPAKALAKVLELKAEGHTPQLVFASGWDANLVPDEAEAWLKRVIQRGGYSIP